MSCAAAATGSCSSSRSRSRDARREGVRGAPDAADAPAETPRRTRVSSGRTSSATRRPSFASRRSSSSRASSPRPSRRCATGRATSTSAWSRSSARSQPDVIVEDNVVSFPALPGVGAAVGADRLLQPRRGQGPATCRRRSRATRAPTARSGAAYGRSTRRALGPLQSAFRRLLPRARRPAARRARVHPHLAVAEPVALPERGRLRARRAARRRLAQRLEIERARHRRRRGAAGAAGRGSRARSSTSASARSARPTSS